MIPAQYRADCETCGLTVDVRRRGIWQQVTGWAENRGPVGGPNAIALRQGLPVYRCGSCMDLIRKGINPRQETILL